MHTRGDGAISSFASLARIAGVAPELVALTLRVSRWERLAFMLAYAPFVLDAARLV